MPRTYEKMHSVVRSLLAVDPDKEAEFDRALAVGELAAEARARDEAMRRGSRAAVRARSTRRSLRPVRQLLGLDAVEVAVTGAAPIPVEILEFFRALGLPLSEMYGLSETSGPSTWEAEHVRLGTVGRASRAWSCASPTTARCSAAVATSSVATSRTPSAPPRPRAPTAGSRPATSASSTAVGYLRIVDRKKELIITAGGKNISPANLEAALQGPAADRTGGAIGDGQPFVVALLVLDPDVAPAWAATHGITESTLDALVRDPMVLAEIDREVDDVNERFSHTRSRYATRRCSPTMATRLRGAHTHDEAQASRHRGEVRGRDRRLYSLIATAHVVALVPIRARRFERLAGA